MGLGYGVCAIMQILSSWTTDFLISRNLCTIVTCRKGAEVIYGVLTVVAFATLAFLDNHTCLAVIVFVFIAFFDGLDTAGHQVLLVVQRMFAVIVI